jgi:hypothetical protein
MMPGLLPANTVGRSLALARSTACLQRFSTIVDAMIWRRKLADGRPRDVCAGYDA